MVPNFQPIGNGIVINNYYLKERLKNLTNNFKGEIFLNHQHKERIYNFLKNQNPNIRLNTKIHEISFIYTCLYTYR